MNIRNNRDMLDRIPKSILVFVQNMLKYQNDIKYNIVFIILWQTVNVDLKHVKKLKLPAFILIIRQVATFSLFVYLCPQTHTDCV